MKRKKWSELEEQTLLSKYSDLLNSGTLAKLKTREKKFRPIADHVNSLHHLQDPITFPFKWSWRDVSIKVQNMRHQYLGVKQKIRISDNEFNWDDGLIHWENFLKYKEVFGDIELSDVGAKEINTLLGGQMMNSWKKFGEEGISDILGCGIDSDELEEEEEAGDEEEEDEDEEEQGQEEGGFGGAIEGRVKEGNENLGFGEEMKLKKGSRARKLRMMGARVLELREAIMRREEKRREREWNREKEAMEKETSRKKRQIQREQLLNKREERLCEKEMELEEMQMRWAKRELDRWLRLEKELDEERRQRMKLEEKREEEEMEWRERMVEMQVEHEKQMMQMHADACQNQLQILGVVARLVCQFFGSANDGLGAGMHPQVLQHPGGGLGDGGKPDDAASPSQFL